MSFARVREMFCFDEYIEEHMDYQTAREGQEYRVCCPACDDDKYKLYVNIDKGLFNCFKCEFSSKNNDLYDFVSKVEGVPKAVVIARLFDLYKEVTPEKIEEDDLFKELPEEYTDLEELKYLAGLPEKIFPLTVKEGSATKYYEYLFERGLTDTEIRVMDTYYCPISTKVGKSDLQGRVLWPIYGKNKQLVSWIARTIKSPYPRPDKYVNAPKSDLSKILWPYLPPNTQDVVIVEGLLDCVATRRAGVYTYATFGKSISRHQVRLLKDWGVENITILYDEDAKSAIKSTASKLSTVFSSVNVVDYRPLEGKDPGDLLKYKDSTILKQIIANRININSFDYLKWQANSL